MAPPWGDPIGILPNFLATEKQSPRSIVWRYLRDPRFSRLDTTQAWDGRTDGQTHDDSIYRTSVARYRLNIFYTVNDTRKPS